MTLSVYISVDLQIYVGYDWFTVMLQLFPGQLVGAP